MRRDLGTSADSHAGPAEDLREWRWRSYLDHLEDLGYDLAHGKPSDEPAAIPIEPDAGADPSRSSRRA